MGWMEAPKAVRQLQRGDPGKSELPGDWTAGRRRRSSAGHRTKTAISSPFLQLETEQRALARISSREKKINLRNGSSGFNPRPRSSVFKVSFWSLSLPQDGRAALISAGTELVLGIFMGIALPTS